MDKPWIKRSTKLNLPIDQLFWEKVKKGNEDDCWEWIAGKARGGYGEFGIKRKIYMAHKISWELVNGEVPDNLCVLHKCDNPACVNPKHLFLGTRIENNNDKVTKGRQAKGEKHGMSKLNEEQVRKIRELYLTGNYSQSKLGQLFNVQEAAIQKIVNYKTWKS